MAINDILPFAQGVGANVQSQADYASEALRTSGNVAGIARSAVNNKALRQASVLASAVAQFAADNQSNNITDSLAPAVIAGYLLAAIRNGVKTDPNFAASLASNGYQKLPSGLIIQWITVSTNASGVVTATLPIAFPNALFKALLTPGGTNSVATLGAVTTSTVGVNCYLGNTGASKSENVQIVAIGY